MNMHSSRVTYIPYFVKNGPTIQIAGKVDHVNTIFALLFIEKLCSHASRADNSNSKSVDLYLSQILSVAFTC